MPVDPKKKWDVFVSYAHVDDLPVGMVDHWVAKFVESLRHLLAMATGHKELSIWCDARMRANERFEGAIAGAISESAVFLALMSPSWNNSGYCAQELDWFSRAPDLVE